MTDERTDSRQCYRSVDSTLAPRLTCSRYKTPYRYKNPYRYKTPFAVTNPLTVAKTLTVTKPLAVTKPLLPLQTPFRRYKPPFAVSSVCSEPHRQQHPARPVPLPGFGVRQGGPGPCHHDHPEKYFRVSGNVVIGCCGGFVFFVFGCRASLAFWRCCTILVYRKITNGYVRSIYDTASVGFGGGGSGGVVCCWCWLWLVLLAIIGGGVVSFLFVGVGV